MKPFLSFIIPAYNEEERLGRSLIKCIEYLGKQSYSYEIIIVDDGSKDRTIDNAKEFGDKIKVIAQGQNLGKGAAVRRGMLEAGGDYRIFSDADFSTPVEELKKLFESFEKGYDVCIGSRALDSSLIKLHQPFYREMMGKTFNKIVQLFAVHGIKDTQCGFKGFTEKAALDIFSKAKINGFAFDVEILYLAKKFDYKIAEIPVLWFNDGKSTVNPIKDSTKMLIEIFKIKRLHRFDFD